MLEVRKSRTAIRIGVTVATVLAVLAALTQRVAAQGCAMCYQNAAASGAQGSEALRHGILILLFPTLSLFVGIFGLIYTRRNTSR